MNKLQKFLEALVGNSGFQVLSKAVKSEDNLRNFAAPRVLVAWLAKSVDEMKAGEKRSFPFPGVGGQIISVRKGTGESYEADVMQLGKSVLSVKADDASGGADLLKFIMTANEIVPSVPVSESSRQVMASVGRLADKLVKSKGKQQKDMEEDHEVHDSKTPEEKYEEYVDSAEDKELKKPVPSIADFERAQSQVRTQPFQKDSMHEQSSPKQKYLRLLSSAKARKAESLSKPPVSEAQRRAMHAAASGHSTLGIPKSVGKEFSDADKPGKLPARAHKKAEMEEQKPVAKKVKVKVSVATKGEMPAGAGIPKQPKMPKPAAMPSMKQPTMASKQAQASGTGKQMLQPKPKMAMKSEPTPTTLRKFSVTEEEASTPCEHCRKPQFKDGKFDPCLCFQVEKHSKEPFAKLVKSGSDLKLEFRKDVDPDSMRAFLLTLKLGLLANKLNSRR